MPITPSTTGARTATTMASTDAWSRCTSRGSSTTRRPRASHPRTTTTTTPRSWPTRTKARAKARERAKVAAAPTAAARARVSARSGATAAGSPTTTCLGSAPRPQACAPRAGWIALRRACPAAASRIRRGASTRATGPRAACPTTTSSACAAGAPRTASTSSRRPAAAERSPPPTILRRLHPLLGRRTASPSSARSKGARPHRPLPPLSPPSTRAALPGASSMAPSSQWAARHWWYRPHSSLLVGASRCATRSTWSWMVRAQPSAPCPRRSY